MFKVPSSRKDHGDTMLIAGFDDRFVAAGAAGLNDCLNPLFRNEIKRVREWEKGIAC